jgi:hypothetical protein
MSERGISPQYHNGLNYNQLGDVASERKREWDGLTIRKLEKKKPYNFKTYQDMIYTYDRRDGKSPYPNSRKETVIPVGSFQAQRASFDGLDPSPGGVTAQTHIIDFYSKVSADDGTWLSSGSNFQSGGTVLVFGPYGTSADRSFLRFPEITISRSATINSAILEITAYNALSGTDSCNVKIYCNDVADAVAPTNTATSQALVLTAATVEWGAIPAWAESVKYKTPELKSIIQGIISKATWASGNALMLVVHNNSSTAGAYRLCHPVDVATVAYRPKLTISYTETIVSGA